MLHMFEDFNLLTTDAAAAAAAAKQAAGEAEAAADQAQSAAMQVIAGAHAGLSRGPADRLPDLPAGRSRSTTPSHGGSIDIQNAAAAATATATPANALAHNSCRTLMTAGSSNAHYLGNATAAASAQAVSVEHTGQGWAGAHAGMISDARGVAQLLQGTVYGLQQHQLLLSNGWAAAPGHGQITVQPHQQQQHPQDSMQNRVLEVLDFSQLNDIEFSKQVQQVMSTQQQQQAGRQLSTSYQNNQLRHLDVQQLLAGAHMLQPCAGFTSSMRPALQLTPQNLLVLHPAANGTVEPHQLPLAPRGPGGVRGTEYPLVGFHHATAGAAGGGDCVIDKRSDSTKRQRRGSRNGTTAAQQNLRQQQKCRRPCRVEQNRTHEVSEVLCETAAASTLCTGSTLAAPLVQFMPIDWGRDKAEKQRQDRESKARKRQNLKVAAAAAAAVAPAAACNGPIEATAAFQLVMSHDHVIGNPQATADAGSIAATDVSELSVTEAKAGSDSQQGTEHGGKQKKYNLGPVKVFKGICGMLGRMVKCQAAKTSLMRYITGEAPGTSGK
jgi:hypothetical protein